MTDRIGYCNGNNLECLFPRSYEEFLFRCAVCNKEDNTRNHGPQSEGQRCPKHKVPFVVAHCPVCGGTIIEGTTFPPASIWAGPNSGKTTYCAALAELSAVEKSTLWKKTGVTSINNLKKNEYLEKVVRPLFDHGVVPRRTNRGEMRKIVMQLSAPMAEGWPQRTFTMTDLAGEVWEMSSESSEGLAELAMNTMLYSKESIFLLDPNASVFAESDGLGANVAPDFITLIQQIMEKIHEFQMLPEEYAPETKSTVQAMVTSIQRYFLQKEIAYPSRINGKDEEEAKAVAREYGEFIGAIIRKYLRSHIDSRLIEQISIKIYEVAKKLQTTPGNVSTLTDLTNYLIQYKYPKRNGKLNHRIALVVTKSDMLPHDFVEDESELGKRRDKQSWRKYLNKVSQKNREIFKQYNLSHLVNYTENNYMEVGYFFVSALGVSTQLEIKYERPRATVNAPTSSRGGGRHDTPQGQAGGKRAKCPWVLEKRVGKAGDDYHRPQPKNVLLPMIWILAGDNG